MNKRKRVAALKHRRRRKNLEERRKAQAVIDTKTKAKA